MTGTDETGRPEDAGRPEPLLREFAAELEVGDGRTIEARIVPYGVPAEVSDLPGRFYREEWAPGCFDEQLKAANRVKVLLNFEHQPGIDGIIGHGTALRDEPDGLHGTFRVKNGQQGDTVLDLVAAGVLDGVSLEAYPRKGGSVRTGAGIVRRTRAHLDKVALCRQPAFKDARVLAVRQAVVLDEELLPLEPDAAQLERARRLGIEIPAGFSRYLEPEEQ